MVKCVCQKIIESKATVSKFPAETGHRGTPAAKPVIKKVTRCHLLPCALCCSSITSSRRGLRSLLPVNLKGSTSVGTPGASVASCEQTACLPTGWAGVTRGDDGKTKHRCEVLPWLWPKCDWRCCRLTFQFFFLPWFSQL